MAVRAGNDVWAAGIAGAAGAVLYAVVEVLGAAVPGSHDTPGARLVLAVATLLLVGGVIGLWRSGVAGDGPLGRAGLVAAAVGWLLAGAAYVVTAIGGVEAVSMFVAGTLLLLIGPVLAGIAAVRARVWPTPWRWAPLCAGLVLLPVTPLLGGDDVAGGVAGAVWMLGWMWVAAGLLRVPSR